MNRQKIRLTSQCNYQCFYCSEYGREPEYIPVDRILAQCARAAKQGVCAIEFGGGEPLLYPDLEKVIGEVKKISGIEEVSIFTNGSLLKERMTELKRAGLDGINLHMDVPDASTYARITGKTQILNDILDVIWSANAKEIPLTITVYLHKESKAYLSVMAGLARKFPVTICYVKLQEYSEACGLDEKEMVRILKRSIEGLKWDGQKYTSPELKGGISFENWSCQTEEREPD